MCFVYLKDNFENCFHSVFMILSYRLIYCKVNKKITKDVNHVIVKKKSHDMEMNRDAQDMHHDAHIVITTNDKIGFKTLPLWQGEKANLANF